MTLTYTREDYIRAMYKLAGFQKGSVSITDLALALDLAKSTVSERVHELAEKKYVALSGTGYALTAKGRSAAAKLTYKHRVIESYLATILHIPAAHVHDEAHLLEHAASDRVIAAMMKQLGHPKKDPHGQPIKKPLAFKP